MGQGRPGHSLFAGAKISLGPVNLTGKHYEDYHLSEIAFIVGRYMVHNSEDGKVFLGAVSGIIAKLWPDRWSDYEEVYNHKDVKRVYFWLNQYGFRSAKGERNKWWLPGDLDQAYADRALLKGTSDPKDVPVAPVIIKCLTCGEGPFENEQAFQAHRDSVHQPAKIDWSEEKEESVEQTTLPVSSSTSMDLVTCPVCNNVLSNEGLKPHLFAAHNKVQCKKCGIVLDPHGMGGHAQAHKLPKTQKLLLQVMREMGDGLPPHVYQQRLDQLLGKTRVQNGRISHLARGLVKRGYLRVEGKTVGTRWYLTAKGRGKAGNGTKPVAQPKATAKASPKATLPEAVAERQPLSQTPIPGGKTAQIFEMVDGKFIIVMDGRTFFVPQMSELVS